MSTIGPDAIKSSIDRFKKVSHNVVGFLERRSELEEEIRDILLTNFSSVFPNSNDFKASNVHMEQIWQQLDLSNNKKKQLSSRITRLEQDPTFSLVEQLEKDAADDFADGDKSDGVSESSDVSEALESNNNDDAEADDDDDDDDDDQLLETELNKYRNTLSLQDDDDNGNGDGDLIEDDNDVDETSSIGSEKSKKENNPSDGGKLPSIVDDNFFKLDEMEQFLNEQDALFENQDQLAGQAEDGDIEDDVDYFRDDSTAETISLIYEEFFDPPKTVRKTSTKQKKKSSFESQQEKLEEKIAQLERENLSKKPWQLTGEVDSNQRPENGLLEEYLEFDRAAKLAPVITDDATETLETLIKRRVKDGLFDDVVRKAKPSDSAVKDFKRRLLLEEQQHAHGLAATSRISLAQVYEQQFFRQLKGGQDAGGDGQFSSHQVEIRQMMKELFAKLDALANYHFVPKAPAAEVKIVRNLPTIAVEEAQPDTLAAGSLVAPQEVDKPELAVPKSNVELSRTAKLRRRTLTKRRAGQRLEKDKEKKKKNSDTAGLKSNRMSSAKFFQQLNQKINETPPVKKRKKKTVE